ncbi:MAG: magnesium transporter, partial [Oscillospiraceae bacterium]|nr:magnesium transporter [Oscillospiraceae bacterium]
VVDAENRLVGIITFDDAMDVMEEEATEDIEKMAAIIPSEKPYMSMTPFEIWKNRIPWLMLLMVSATFTGLIISRFESALEKLVILTAFIPMLMDTAGNSGSQASVTVIRGLSLNEIEFSDILLIIWKEVRVAVLCGLSLGIACFGKILLVDYLIMDSFAGVSSPFLIIGVICITLSVTVLFAKIVGCTLPLFAKKLGFDPAVMASPFITTIVDALSLLVYFGVASAFLPI